jgi:flagellar protein FliL
VNNSKLIITMLIILITITLIALVAFFVVLNKNGSAKDAVTEPPSIDEIIEASVDIEEVTTNLLDGDFIKIKFKIQTDSKKAKEELEKRDFQVRNIIIQEVSEVSADDFKGREGILKLESLIKENVNKLMQKGKVERVYTTSFVIQ